MTKTQAAQEYRMLAAQMRFSAETAIEAGRVDVAAVLALFATVAAECARFVVEG